MYVRIVSLAFIAGLLALLPSSAQNAPSGMMGSPGKSASHAAPHSTDPWWKHAVIYEIYPRSFQDSNRDGVGDLNGITRRLDYLRDLGVDAIWIAPIYPSPQVDFGYDISDYQNIDPQYGTLADFDRLVAQAKKRNIRVLMDAVMNHTSDKHPWFIESESSKTNPKRNWYVWRDGRAPGEPPNNWLSLFGHSAWQFSPRTGQYYYHYFYIQQPDLNWRNPQVEAAMFQMLRFWLDRGVAGFRLDAITALLEDPQLRDEPVLGGTNAQGDPNLNEIYTNDLPGNHDIIRRMRAMIDTYPGDRLLVGETYVAHTAQLDPWYGGARHDELQLPMDTLVGLDKRLDAGRFRRLLSEAQTELHGGQPLLVFDNHDQIRSWDRYGDGVHNAAIARIIAALLLTSRDAALLYQGEEIGQITATPSRVEDVRDPIGITGWPKEKGRDGERTPMQWDGSAQAGFSANPHTWLPVTANYPTVNVATESADPQSLLNWYKRLIALRRSSAALRDGRTVMLDASNPHVLTYARTAPGGETVLVSLNMSAERQTIPLGLAAAGLHGTQLRTLLASPAPVTAAAADRRVTLEPFAAWVASVN